jgi:hypothetical protein
MAPPVRAKSSQYNPAEEQRLKAAMWMGLPVKTEGPKLSIFDTARRLGEDLQRAADVIPLLRRQ